MGRETLDLSRGRDRHHLLAARHRLDQANHEHTFGPGLRIHRADVRNKFCEFPGNFQSVRVSRPAELVGQAASLTPLVFLREADSELTEPRFRAKDPSTGSIV